MMRFAGITELLPPSRTRLRGLALPGFVPDGELPVGGRRFLRYRLDAETYRKVKS